MSKHTDSDGGRARAATGDEARAGGDASSEAATTIARALAEAAATLRAGGVEGARREAATLLSATIERDRAFLIAHDDDALRGASLSTYRERVRRRAAGEPLQYVTGRQEFYGLEFEVTPAVLIPRPETELLVETALEILRDLRAPLLCDVGTGSGCIAVALLGERADARAVAVDISADALAVAARNAARHGVGERLALVASDCFAALDPAAADGFDLVVSNPPYVAEADIAGLQREVRDHEPRGALTPGGDGLSVIRRLLSDAPPFLKPGGRLLFEIGFGQREAVVRLAGAGAWGPPDIRDDLQGIPRAVALRLSG